MIGRAVRARLSHCSSIPGGVCLFVYLLICLRFILFSFKREGKGKRGREMSMPERNTGNGTSNLSVTR